MVYCKLFILLGVKERFDMSVTQQSVFMGTTNLFFSGTAMVLIVPKNVLEELKLDTENKKAHFNIYVDKKKQEITYQLIGESDK